VTKLLLHICCAPCTIYPLKRFREQNICIRGFFYNPNIHPLDEYKKRLDALYFYANAERLEVIYEEYEIEEYFDFFDKNEDRCIGCYRLRLQKTVSTAKKLGYDTFSTTLLYSIRQKHHLIKQIGEELEKQYNIKFWYEDFRTGWKEAIKESISLNLYRQNYCGCIFSEKERFFKKS